MQTGNEYYKVKDIIFKNVSVIFKGGVSSVPDEPAEFENRILNPMYLEFFLQVDII